MVSVTSVGSGEQCVAGCATGRSLHVVAKEWTAFGSQFVNIRGLNVINTKGFEFRAKVVDTDEKHVGFSLGRQYGTEEAQAHEDT